MTIDVLTAQGPLVIGDEAAPIGHNNPPAPTPYEAIKAHIDDLEMEAKNFLDGDPIETEEQAAAIDKLLDNARKARKAAEDQRKIEAKPFDEGKAAVQALWTPLSDEKKGRCALIEQIAKKALAPFLQKKEDAVRAAADAARVEADRLAAVARQAAREAAATDLTSQAEAHALAEEAALAAKQAEKIGNTRAQVKGGERATSLRSVWHVTLTDRRETLKHYILNRTDELEAWLLDQVEKDCRAGKRNIPGASYTEERVPV